MPYADEHPFADRWNHNTHYYPDLAARLAGTSGGVLDIGCGEGTFARYLSSQGYAVTGCDVDLQVLPRADRDPTYVCATAESLPFRDGGFAAVTMTMVLHHISAERGIAEAVRVLAPGGRLVVLGYGSIGSWRDRAYEVRDLYAHRRLSRRMTQWDPPTAQSAERPTWAETREVAARMLPGCDYRRLPLWRYLVTWSKPERSGR